MRRNKPKYRIGQLVCCFVYGADDTRKAVPGWIVARHLDGDGIYNYAVCWSDRQNDPHNNIKEPTVTEMVELVNKIRNNSLEEED